jgi:hypothetical protein
MVKKTGCQCKHCGGDGLKRHNPRGMYSACQPGPGPSGRRGVACDVGLIDTAHTRRNQKYFLCAN